MVTLEHKLLVKNLTNLPNDKICKDKLIIKMRKKTMMRMSTAIVNMTVSLSNSYSSW